MSLRLRLSLVILLVISGGLFLSLRSLLYDLRPQYLASMEEVLIDTAGILASQVHSDLREQLYTGSVSQTMTAALQRTFDARIYQKRKTAIDLNVYMCNTQGRVVYSSADSSEVGRDYSRWNDVYLCLQGKYGARVTLADTTDETSGILYVAAAIYHQGAIVGSLTVSKPSDSVSVFVRSAQKQIITISIISAVIMSVVLVVVGVWVTRPIKTLEHFVRETASGNNPAKPVFSAPELMNVSHAISDLRSALDGKQYVESYIQQLTHEFKGPLSVISGASELLADEMSEQQRQHFIDNITNETERMRELVDRILLLANVENRDVRSQVQNIDMRLLMHDVVHVMQVLADERMIQIHIVPQQDTTVQVIQADPFLIELALRNIILNAIEFCPDGEKISLNCEHTGAELHITCTDHGPGIPDYLTTTNMTA